jgi:hypothetical protein
MFFLLRMAFWLGLVLVLLPTDKSKESDKAPQVATSDAISAATAAVYDMSQFCNRQPNACAVGGQAASVIGHRAQMGARKLYGIITEKRAAEPEKRTPEADKRAPDHTGSIGPIEHTHLDGGDTLSPADLEIEWHAPLAENTADAQ